ncbi:Variant surface glycoprotein [Trypanosoma congolense IL3000]|uniref:Variant surface glycoprotein n=1 Tax=Trypanosoma congolense (strain IL3000) TaxID=1068625 RepID=F9W3S6_TRYCI|nr:Variant surface glycoprotein [Trypanosoma congolense IL3000]
MKRMMKFCTMSMVVMVVLEVSARSGDTGAKKHHNKDEHSRLCAVLNAAAHKWSEVHTREPADPLRKALGRTIFGDENGGDLGSLKGELPGDYKGVEKIRDSRASWCGEPHEGGYNGENQARWSGHSAPHNMICLCTLGNLGWPLNESDDNQDTLCGKTEEDLGGGKEGWSDKDQDKGEKQIQATWFNVTKECLQDGKENNLKDALDTFVSKLELIPDGDFYPNRYRLGDNGVGSYPCTGNGQACVMYFPTMDPKPWWKDLEAAIKEDAKLQKQRDEEEKRKQQEKVNDNDQPRAERLSATPPTTNQSEQPHKTNNLTDKLRRFNLTSGTPISQPSSWLLSAILLI